MLGSGPGFNLPMFWWKSRRLQNNLKSHLGYVRDEAWRELRQMRGSGAIKLLIQVAAGPTRPAQVRQEAVELLGQKRSTAATAIILRILDDPEADIGLRRAATTALGQIGDSAAVKPLMQAAEGRGLEREAAVALGMIGDREAAPVLLRLLGHGVADSAVGLDKIDPSWRTRAEVKEMVRALIGSLTQYPTSARNALNSIDPEWRQTPTAQAMVPPAVEVLRAQGQGPDRDPEKAAHAAALAGELCRDPDRDLAELLVQTCLTETDRARLPKESLAKEVVLERAVTSALEQVAPLRIGPETFRARSILRRISNSSGGEEVRALRELEDLLAWASARISGDCLREIAAMERRVIHYSVHATRDDEPYSVPAEVKTDRCVDLAAAELRHRR